MKIHAHEDKIESISSDFHFALRTNQRGERRRRLVKTTSFNTLGIERILPVEQAGKPIRLLHNALLLSHSLVIFRFSTNFQLRQIMQLILSHSWLRYSKILRHFFLVRVTTDEVPFAVCSSVDMNQNNLADRSRCSHLIMHYLTYIQEEICVMLAIWFADVGHWLSIHLCASKKSSSGVTWFTVLYNYELGALNRLHCHHEIFFSLHQQLEMKSLAE